MARGGPPLNGATPTLHTPRLRLDPLREIDAESMTIVLADPALHAFTGAEPLGAAALRQRFARLTIGRSGDGTQLWHNWIVRIATDGTAVGTVQATVAADEPTAEVAWVIGVPWQGRGYATEAAQALVAWLESVGVTTITAHIHPDHEASAVVASRAGLSPTTELEDGERVWRRTMFPG